MQLILNSIADTKCLLTEVPDRDLFIYVIVHSLIFWFQYKDISESLKLISKKTCISLNVIYTENKEFRERSQKLRS